MQGKIFEGDYKTRCKNIDSLLCVGDTFDMLKREIRLGDRHAVFYMIDGFLKGEVLEKILEFFLSLAPEDVPETYEDFLKKQKTDKCPYLSIDSLFFLIIINLRGGYCVV